MGLGLGWEGRISISKKPSCELGKSKHREEKENRNPNRDITYDIIIITQLTASFHPKNMVG